MANATGSPLSKPEAYDAYRAGDLSEDEAKEFFGDEWDEVAQLERVVEILDRQSEPDVDSDELYR